MTSGNPTPRETSSRPVSEERTPSSALLRQLSAHAPKQSRYRILGEIARGGMGAILRVWDEDLNRHSAMKVILGRDPGSKDTPPVDEARLGRFLEEAQVTGQLNHPGIVPVHELGLGDDGRVYFTMRLLNGHDLRTVFDRARRNEGGWSLVRAVGVLAKVCEAMAYAHSKGVLHRDLKPSNVMVGRFGETYVMDWGLARVEGREREAADIRPRPEASTVPYVVSDMRPGEAEGSPVVTVDGDVLGTPSFMPPEQARGELDRLGPRSDVYAVGAMLYQLLAGRAPYVPPEGRASPYTILRWVLDGPPTPLYDTASDAPPELVAICEKAMRREVEERYSGMRELLDDLRAYLEGRVVRAHRTGVLVEMSKWVRRNRAAAVASTVALVVLVAGTLGVLRAELRRASEVRLERDMRAARDLVAEVDSLGPNPTLLSELRRWLLETDELGARREAITGRYEGFLRDLPPLGPLPDKPAELVNVERQLDVYPEALARSLRVTAAERSVYDNDTIHFVPGEIARLSECLPGLRRQHERSREHPASDPRRLEYIGLKQLNEDLEDLFDFGLYARVESWLLTAETLEVDTVLAHIERWEEVADSVGRTDSPYRGLHLEPQVGLVPLRTNEAGLWEFWHVSSGAAPEIADDGTYVIRAETGMVLILVPGGSFEMSFRGDSIGVELDPFFLSKYETTQGQWMRMTGQAPSEHSAGLAGELRRRIGWTHPVERVSWEDCERSLARFGLGLPTEAQSLWASHAGEGWEPLCEPERVGELVNGRDCAYLEFLKMTLDPEALDDTWELHSPVDALQPNPWGFHGAFGNVSEWCSDWFCQKFGGRFLSGVRHGTGELLGPYRTERTFRGGSFKYKPENMTERSKMSPRQFDDDIGIRAFRALERKAK